MSATIEATTIKHAELNIWMPTYLDEGRILPKFSVQSVTYGKWHIK